MPKLRTSLIDDPEELSSRLVGDEALMNVTSEISLAWLNARLNNRVQRVEIEFRLRTNEHYAAVLFKNHRALHVPLAKLRTDEFVATCMLVYDLPRDFE